LIFHHFGNKQALWQSVKHEIVAKAKLDFKPDVSSLRAFVGSVVRSRFKLYQESPDLCRLMQWQMLEGDEASVGGTEASPPAWLKSIEYLKQRGVIRHNIDSRLVVILLASSTSGAFLQNKIELTEQEQLAYQQLVIEACVSALTSGSEEA